MNHSWKVGFNFGVTSGIITTLGLMIGLDSATGSKLAVIGGIMTIAVADACSDAVGIHVSEEGENKHTRVEVWQSTISTFLFKFVFASIFIIAFLFLEITTAVWVNIIVGFILLTVFSYKLAKNEKSEKPIGVVLEHLILTAIVLVASYFVGKLVGSFFN